MHWRTRDSNRQSESQAQLMNNIFYIIGVIVVIVVVLKLFGLY